MIMLLRFPGEMAGMVDREKKVFNIQHATTNSGVYFWYSKDGELLYIGESENVRKRLLQHGPGLSGILYLGGYIKLLIVDCCIREEMERILIKEMRPVLNKFLASRPPNTHASRRAALKHEEREWMEQCAEAHKNGKTHPSALNRTPCP